MTGERGICLFGGQRQHIGIASGALPRSVSVGLDEATGALDGVTEEMVLSVMLNTAKLKTPIVFAQHMTAVKASDLVFNMQGGMISESGILRN